MKITKRKLSNAWALYAATVLPILALFDLYLLLFEVKESVMATMCIVLVSAYLLWFLLAFKIESIWIDRFICIMKQHPRKELLRAYTAKGKKYEDKDVVLVEYHCELCDATILENKLYKDIK